MLSDSEFKQLLDYLDRPWAGFRKVRKGVKKRIRRHMEQLGCGRFEPYLDRIEEDPQLRSQCEQCLTITISRFYRDRRLWDHLQQQILPRLSDRFGDGLAAWSAGCANGEEPYSLAMVWAAAAVRPMAALNVLATDADVQCLQRAETGRYPISSLKELPEDVKTRWFRKERGGRRWCVDPALQQRITWQVHHLLEIPPPGPFHLIFLRNNLLTYYRGSALEVSLSRIVARLADGGILAVGSNERLPSSTAHLEQDRLCACVYHYSTGEQV